MFSATINLAPGEHILRLTGQISTFIFKGVSKLKIYTSTGGVHGPYGSFGGSASFDYSGDRLLYLSGKAVPYFNQIIAHFLTC